MGGGGFFGKVTRFVAPAVGIATGNPWLAAAAGAVSGAARGGGVKGALTQGALSGIGGALGGAAGLRAGAMLGGTAGAIGSYLGTGLGAAYMTSQQNGGNTGNSLPPVMAAPSFTELKKEAVDQTEAVFQQTDVAKIFRENMRRRFGTYKNIYNFDRFSNNEKLLRKKYNG